MNTQYKPLSILLSKINRINQIDGCDECAAETCVRRLIHNAGQTKSADGCRRTHLEKQFGSHLGKEQPDT